MLKYWILSGKYVTVYEIRIVEFIISVVSVLFKQIPRFYVLPDSTYCFEIVNLKSKTISTMICVWFFSCDWNRGNTEFRVLSLQILGFDNYI